MSDGDDIAAFLDAEASKSGSGHSSEDDSKGDQNNYDFEDPFVATGRFV